MEKIKWDAAFQTGHPIVDGQHKNLFTLVNKLQKAISENKSKMAVQDSIDLLTVYINTHFKTEEEIMQSNGYPDFEAHKKVHDGLKEHTLKLIKLYHLNKVDLTATIYNFLSEWIQNHIKETDYKMIRWLNEQTKLN